MQIRQSDMEAAVGRLYLQNTALELRLAEAAARIKQLEEANVDLSKALAGTDDAARET